MVACRVGAIFRGVTSRTSANNRPCRVPSFSAAGVFRSWRSTHPDVVEWPSRSAGAGSISVNSKQATICRRSMAASLGIEPSRRALRQMNRCRWRRYGGAARANKGCDNRGDADRAAASQRRCRHRPGSSVCVLTSTRQSREWSAMPKCRSRPYGRPHGESQLKRKTNAGRRVFEAFVNAADPHAAPSADTVRAFRSVDDRSRNGCGFRVIAVLDNVKCMKTAGTRRPGMPSSGWRLEFSTHHGRRRSRQ